MFSSGDINDLHCSAIDCNEEINIDQYRRPGGLCDECEFQKWTYDGWDTKFLAILENERRKFF